MREHLVRCGRMDGHLWTTFTRTHRLPSFAPSTTLHTHTHSPPAAPPYIYAYVNPTPPPPPNPFIGGTTTYMLQIRMKKVATGWNCNQPALYS